MHFQLRFDKKLYEQAKRRKEELGFVSIAEYIRYLIREDLKNASLDKVSGSGITAHE